MRVIFLDIDGVLNDINCESKLFRNTAVQTLADIVNKTKAKIVLSSTWKQIMDCTEIEHPDAYHQWQQLIQTLASHGLKITDTTPNLNDNRPLEISEYLKQHTNITSWVSIEDDFGPEHYKVYGYENHLFQTKFFVHKTETGGLKQEHIPAILQMFKKQEL